MPTQNPQRTIALLAIGITGILFAGGRTPAHAACAPGAADKPDLAFEDSNCDGIDGDKASAIFVAPGGDDSHSGSFGSPMKTVAAAAPAALSAGKDVYVAAGTYDGKVALLGAGGHIGIYGGYDAATWQRSAATVTTLRAPGQVVSVAVPGVVLQMLTVQGVSDPSFLTSYGVRAFNTGTVALSRMTVNAAPGRKGTDGGVPPAPPAATPDGKPGARNCDLIGGAGGGVGVPGVLAGGTGGSAWNQTQQWKGWDGASDPGVLGGWGGQDQGQSGGQGSSGLAGTDGQGGSAALNYAAIFYQAMQGGSGTKGTRGAGGGGGAAGEACLTGPGGGAGGLPGEGGMGGWGGGGSIGVFAGAGAHVIVTDGTVIHTANGGNGGVGGTYQSGGPGGQGAPGGDYWDDYNKKYYKAGDGGDGGYGGHGGRGGGGAGGASIGVLAINASKVVDEDTTTITVGAGGQGGIGGFNGKTGLSSLATQVTTAGGSIPAVGDFDGDGLDDSADSCPIVAAPGGCPAPAGGGGTPGGGTPGGGTPAGGTTGGGTTGGGTTTGGTTGGTPAAGSTPATVGVLPASSCFSRRAFTIRINARRAHLKSGRLTLDGRRLRLVKGARIWKARVDLRRSTRTRHTLTIRGTLLGGQSFKQTRRYRTCAR